MPELPEVETIIRDLKKFLPGLKIRDIWTDIIKFKKIKKQVADEKILKIERRGKNILIELTHNKTLLIHLKLTGHLLYGIPKNRFVHLIFFLSNGKQLALSDLRKFAKVVVLPTEKISEEFKKLGPDPFDKDFNFRKFAEILPKRGKIKTVLMNQEIISGIGNIYSDEILWLAGVHPLKPVQKLKEGEIKKIYQAIKPVLKKAINARGSSYIDYRDALGRKGKYQNMQYAYGMEGEKCKKRDGGIIKRIKIGGRSAHFCPLHQKL
jgi:formamidopyrimidine-DNA glycosylase